MKSSEAMIGLRVKGLGLGFALITALIIALITAKIIASLDFISAVHI